MTINAAELVSKFLKNADDKHIDKNLNAPASILKSSENDTDNTKDADLSATSIIAEKQQQLFEEKLWQASRQILEEINQSKIPYNLRKTLSFSSLEFKVTKNHVGNTIRKSNKEYQGNTNILDDNAENINKELRKSSTENVENLKKKSKLSKSTTENISKSLNLDKKIKKVNLSSDELVKQAIPEQELEENMPFTFEDLKKKFEKITRQAGLKAPKFKFIPEKIKIEGSKSKQNLEHSEKKIKERSTFVTEIEQDQHLSNDRQLNLTRNMPETIKNQNGSIFKNSEAFNSDFDLTINHNCQCETEKCIKERTKKEEAEILQENEVNLNKVLNYISNNIDNYLTVLGEFVKVKSISQYAKNFFETRLVIDMMAEKLARLKFHVIEVELNIESNDPWIKFPKQTAILASYFSSPNKNTVLIYGYLDVFPADIKDGWLDDPFAMVNSSGVIFGRGVSAGKGPAICWINAIDAWLQETSDLPINVKCIFQAQHEVGSPGLEEHLKEHKDFFKDVDYILTFSNAWFNDKLPVINCSHFGWIHFALEVKGPAFDLDSGCAGGIVYEPMTEMCHLINSFFDNQQNVRVPNFETYVNTLSAADWEILDEVQFSLNDYKEKFNVRRLPHESTRTEALLFRWCKPTITIHSLEGGYTGKNVRTVIPGTVKVKFTVKLVPDQLPEKMIHIIEEHLKSKHENFHSPNYVTLTVLDSVSPVIIKQSSPGIRAIKKAVSRIHGIVPKVSTTLSTCRPACRLLQKYADRDILLLPYSSVTDRRQQPNESIEETLYQRNILLAATMLNELAAIPPKCKCEQIPEYCNRPGLSTSMDKHKHKDKRKSFMLATRISRSKDKSNERTTKTLTVSEKAPQQKKSMLSGSLFERKRTADRS